MQVMQVQVQLCCQRWRSALSAGMDVQHLDAELLHGPGQHLDAELLHGLGGRHASGSGIIRPTGHAAKRDGAATPALKSNALQTYNRGFRTASIDAAPWR